VSVHIARSRPRVTRPSAPPRPQTAEDLARRGHAPVDGGS